MGNGRAWGLHLQRYQLLQWFSAGCSKALSASPTRYDRSQLKVANQSPSWVIAPSSLRCVQREPKNGTRFILGSAPGWSPYLVSPPKSLLSNQTHELESSCYTCAAHVNPFQECCRMCKPDLLQGDEYAIGDHAANVLVFGENVTDCRLVNREKCLPRNGLMPLALGVTRNLKQRVDNSQIQNGIPQHHQRNHPRSLSNNHRNL
eukprot:5872214-Amphidinium_carterae.1